MPQTKASLQHKIKLLEEQNLQLQKTCQQLQTSQETLERVSGENNAQLLRAEMTSMELEQVFSACTDALWVIRDDGIVIRANQAMLDLLDKPLAAVVGQECCTLLDYHRCHKDSCPLVSGKKDKLEFDIQLSTATAQHNDYILSTAPLITLDGCRGIVGQFKNITSRKKAEEELARANVALAQMARSDGLTQIANRRGLDEALAREWGHLQRQQQPLSLLLGDIDFFKKYNDRYGHQAGDDCLRLIAKALSDSTLRPADLAARYGGEEFALLLPGVDQQGALNVAQRVLAAISQLKIEHQDSPISEVITISLGAATLQPSAQQTPGDLIALADKALYQAKQEGRNRVIPARP